MENHIDAKLEALLDFMKQEKKIVSQELKEIICGIAKSGRYIYQWEYLKPLYAYELQQVMDNFMENFPPKNANGTDAEKLKELENERNSILKTFNHFTSAPFTIQRVSELIIQPRKHYKTCAKFFRGLNKNLLVVSTVDPEESEASTIDPIDSDQEETPSKKLRLDSVEEARMRTANEQRPPVLQHNRSSKIENTVLTNGSTENVTDHPEDGTEQESYVLEDETSQEHSRNEESIQEVVNEAEDAIENPNNLEKEENSNINIQREDQIEQNTEGTNKDESPPEKTDFVITDISELPTPL